jgi:hypothetical protein
MPSSVMPASLRILSVTVGPVLCTLEFSSDVQYVMLHNTPKKCSAVKTPDLERVCVGRMARRIANRTSKNF